MPVTSLPLGADVRSGVPLSGYTTLRLGGPAARFVTAGSAAEVVDAVKAVDRSGEPLLVLGGGSNLVIGDLGFDGTVVLVANHGSKIDCVEPGRVQLTVEAGEDWDTVVAGTVEAGLGGLECLSGIPGLVGATPVQNVGAYGVEVSQVLVSVDLLDRATGEVRTLRTDELGLDYRTSVLKGTDRAVVLRARFELSDDGLSAPVRYTELARALGVRQDERVPVADARAAVLDLRRGKGMVLDPIDHDTWSAGSFFTNPIIPLPAVDDVLARIVAVVGPETTVPRYPAGPGAAKLSAAWLIERAGFGKGFARGPVGLSTKHTLALTNRGSATTADLLALAKQVRDGVHTAFGVALHPEPILINCALT
ncbi:UDP-N-acetylmuramate dehydrogenase [Actinokineospora globicatena]|uniref:UDP-N-acetylenolpyruvoylglucosamine reductase n=1 Tax=Actinokineospora globicatena TaxID=103729 RepID=A0A9W6QRV5_9PSEU|nr:UDP-N-acetylmuramate dehydrogenase [Actinokineospora globicatena]GLW76689.1 UDP-N-acetylenolpyruvoylglucosamine reductase [Actinokineospora globicatena]GLW83522.1 UDP-N-acetylenolpyruvoylglucosamine reductase [Actinokineospora globicatena]GLW95716.1 UDP-N-acetylenolpyruvoylglucosamine reductase [Actinokineospora globicatena]